MNPKDKARELVDRFRPHALESNMGFLVRYHDNTLKEAKQCALICVEEILSMGWEVIKFHTIKNYWEEVKHEIINYNE